MKENAVSEFIDEFDEDGHQRTPLEFHGANGLILRELTSVDDASEMLELINANRDNFAEYAPEFNQIQTELDAIKMLGNQSFSTYGARTAATKQLAGIVTVAQETEDRVSLGYAVGKDFQRQGIASEAVKTISENYLKIPNINTVRCYIKPKNQASRRLLVQCGFYESGGIPYRNVFYDLDKPVKTT